jgi:hypothetical protein
MDEFFRTQMGQRFFEGTLPRLVAQLQRLNDNLERIARVLEARGPAAPEVGGDNADQARS